MFLVVSADSAKRKSVQFDENVEVKEVERIPEAEPPRIDEVTYFKPGNCGIRDHYLTFRTLTLVSGVRYCRPDMNVSLSFRVKLNVCSEIRERSAPNSNKPNVRVELA